MRITAFVVGVALASAGCGGDGGAYPIADTPLAGVVGGAPWSFAAGEISAFLSDDDDFFAELYASEYETCGFGGPDGDLLLVAVPTEVGDYEMSLARNMTFVVGSDNLVATDGRIIVDEVTPTLVRARLYGRYDDANEVSGTFELARCAD